MLFMLIRRHFGSYDESAIQNGELCESSYPKSPFSTHGRFRINELTRLVPMPVRSVLRNDKRENDVSL